MQIVGRKMQNGVVACLLMTADADGWEKNAASCCCMFADDQQMQMVGRKMQHGVVACLLTADGWEKMQRGVVACLLTTDGWEKNAAWCCCMFADDSRCRWLGEKCSMVLLLVFDGRWLGEKCSMVLLHVC